MSADIQEPKIDFGFHAVIPRIVRTGYKHLSHAQKWLYACLKDLCGDKGTCYRSLRALAIETDMSTGLLSESIPVLHDAGLIHAEMKKRATGGKAVWHISIVDIWKANGEKHPTKRKQDAPIPLEECSENEQECSENEQPPNSDSENVQNVNKNVQNVNKSERECSENERERSENETEVITVSNTNKKVIPVRQERGNRQVSVSPRTPQKQSSVVSSQKNTPSRSGEKKKIDLFASSSPEVQAIITEWLDVFQGSRPITKTLIEQAEAIAAYKPLPGEVAKCRLWQYATDRKKWYAQHGHDLGDVAREFGKFRSLQTIPAADDAFTFPSGLGGDRGISSFDNPDYDMSSETYGDNFLPSSKGGESCSSRVILSAAMRGM